MCLFSGQMQWVPVNSNPSLESQLLCADAVYTFPKSERLDHVTTGQVLSDSSKFKNSPSEFLLGV